MSMVDEQFAFLQDVMKLVAYAAQLGFKVTGGELFRTPEQQAIYIQKGLTHTSNSYHLKRLAIDLNFFKDDSLVGDISVLTPLGNYWQSLNPKNSAGMLWESFKDTDHFERRA
jgi:hypothetical protein